jgi:hypothetical protein
VRRRGGSSINGGRIRAVRLVRTSFVGVVHG